MPTRICLEPGCAEAATYRGRCQSCATARNRETKSANAPLYATAKWRNTRKRYLFDHPLCERCGNEIASEVHHRVDIQAGGDPWAWDNLEALDKRCHSQATRAGQIGATT